jgi:hypothetical protein
VKSEEEVDDSDDDKIVEVWNTDIVTE